MAIVRVLFLCLCMCMLSSCVNKNRKYYMATSKNGLFHNQTASLLGEAGDTYQRRGDYLTQVGSLKPEKQESYAHFHSRLINTLTIQDYDIQMLEESLEKKSEQIEYLQVQLEQLLQENADLHEELEDQDEPLAAQPQQERSSFEVYTVQKGDTLQKIAVRKYGTYTGWLAIYRFNLEQLPHGPNRVDVGQKLFLPQSGSSSGYRS